LKQSAFYLQHLSRVSRSFAYCIERLGSPEREWVGLAYILCRLVDTVEDSQWNSRTGQENAFLSFMRFIQDPVHDPQDVRKWVATFPSQIPEGERLLLEDANVFFTDLHELNEAQRRAIQDRVLDMTRGMLYFSQNFSDNGHLRLKTTEQTNQYCFFVAGVVGELLTNLVMPEIVSDDLLLDAYHFGFYLQKVNLLKDYWTDGREGRFFLPDFKQAREQVDRHARFALKYLEAIPMRLREYRLFCAWSLFLGLGSLKWIEKSREDKPVKIPRLKALGIFHRVEQNIDSPPALREEFERYLPGGAVEDTLKTPFVEVNPPPWFTDIYTGRLNLNSMAQLGMVEI
jgi:phytoene/squalene synthetase